MLKAGSIKVYIFYYTFEVTDTDTPLHEYANCPDKLVAEMLWTGH